ncbi:hypothetical protein COU61_00030 [Candidatus Pacearchaeota archaeon CG10_big_fil_rev_8_21_14_0_10_35_13]|nr:MAG: hypothetical protein COU61_00030 [Candidatus Pacearchaeota archaeon CG10_big_fil_rev_8_21_14_0_10_35_13]
MIRLINREKIKDTMEYKTRYANKKDDKNLKDFWEEGKKKGFFKYNGDNKILSESWNNKNNSYMIIAINDKRKIIGLCVVIGREEGRMKHRVELGWLVHPDHARKGIATRMLKEVIRRIKKDKIKRAEAEIAIKNTASIKLVKKFGFIKESKREKGLTLDNGKYIDTYLYKKIF